MNDFTEWGFQEWTIAIGVLFVIYVGIEYAGSKRRRR